MFISYLSIFLYFFRRDSVVTDEINYDLLKHLDKIQNGSISCPELLGYFNQTKTQENIPQAVAKADVCCST